MWFKILNSSDSTHFSRHYEQKKFFDKKFTCALNIENTTVPSGDIIWQIMSCLTLGGKDDSHIWQITYPIWGQETDVFILFYKKINSKTTILLRRNELQTRTVTRKIVVRFYFFVRMEIHIFILPKIF